MSPSKPLNPLQGLEMQVLICSFTVMHLGNVSNGNRNYAQITFSPEGGRGSRQLFVVGYFNPESLVNRA